MNTYKLISSSTILLTIGGFLSFSIIGVDYNQNVTSSRNDVTLNELKQTKGINPNDTIGLFQKYIKDNPQLVADYKAQHATNEISLTQRISGFKDDHGTEAWRSNSWLDGNQDHETAFSHKIVFTSNASTYSINGSNYDYANIVNSISQTTLPQDFNIDYYGDLGTSPSGYHLYNNAWVGNQYPAAWAIRDGLRDKQPVWNWQDILKSSLQDKSTSTRLIISPQYTDIQPIHFVGEKTGILYYGDDIRQFVEKDLNENVLDSAGLTKIGSETSGHTEPNGQFLLAPGDSYNVTGVVHPTGGGDSPLKENYDVTVDYSGFHFLPSYYDLYTEGKCALTYYYGTNYTITLFNENNNGIGSGDPIISMLKYDPSQLIQFDNVGYDKSARKYWTQSNLNKDLLTGVLGYKYDYDYLNALDKNGHTYKSKMAPVYNMPLYERDLSGLSFINQSGTKVDNPDTFLNLEPTYYYGQTIGLKNIKGGQDIWAPIGDTTDSSGNPATGLSVTDYPGLYNNANYQLAMGKLLAFLDNVSRDVAGYPYHLSYDNYLAARDWFRNYILTYHHFPRFDDAVTDPTNNFFYQIESGNLKNNGWYDKATQYGINSSSALDDLAILYPTIDFNEWNMEDTTGTNTDGWTNKTQEEFLGPNSDSGVNYANYNDIINGGNRITYDTIPTTGSSFNIITNTEGMRAGITSHSLNGLTAQAQHNWGDNSDQTHEIGSVNGVANLSARTSGAISENDNCTFTKYAPDGKTVVGTYTTKGIQISKSGNIIRRIDDPSIKDQVDVMVKAYVDEPGFYDTKTANPNFNADKYTSDKYDPSNQPYMLKPAGTIFRQLKSNSNDISDLAALKLMFYDHKNNNQPALNFVEMNLYDNDSWNYNVPEDQIEVAIDDASGQLTTRLYAPGVDHHTNSPIDSYTTSGFETSTDPYVPTPDGVKPNNVGIIVGSCIGGVILIAVVWIIIANRRRGVKGINPEVKKLKKAGEYED